MYDYGDIYTMKNGKQVKLEMVRNAPNMYTLVNNADGAQTPEALAAVQRDVQYEKRQVEDKIRKLEDQLTIARADVKKLADVEEIIAEKIPDFHPEVKWVGYAIETRQKPVFGKTPITYSIVVYAMSPKMDPVQFGRLIGEPHVTQVGTVVTSDYFEPGKEAKGNYEYALKRKMEMSCNVPFYKLTKDYRGWDKKVELIMAVNPTAQ